MASAKEDARTALMDYLAGRGVSSSENYSNGKIAYLESHETWVLVPPDVGYVCVVHEPSLRLFRTVVANSTKLAPTGIGSLIGPMRLWIARAMKEKLGDVGRIIAGVERNDSGCLAEFAAHVKRREDARIAADKAVAAESQRQAREADAARAAAREASKPQPISPVVTIKTNPNPTPAQPVAQRNSQMSLLDVETKTKRVVLEETSSSLKLDHARLRTLCRQAGVNIPSSASLKVFDPDGELIVEIGGDTTVEFNWTTTTETTQDA